MNCKPAYWVFVLIGTVCYSGNTFTLQNASINNVSWTVSGNLRIVSGQGTKSVTVRAASTRTSGSGWVKASVCGGTSVTKDVWVGLPKSIGGSLSGPSSVSVGQLVTYTHSDGTHPNNGSYDWTLPYNQKRCTDCWTIFTGGDGNNQIRAIAGSTSGYVQVRKRNVCGNGGAKIKYVTVNGDGGGGPIRLRISPNPVTDKELNVYFTSNKTNKKAIESDFQNDIEYVIIDINGQVKHTSTSGQMSRKISLKKLERNKKYTLIVKYKGTSKSEQVHFIVK